MTVLLISIFAHILGDFIFQTDTIAKAKKKIEISAFTMHVVIIFITIFLMLLIQYEFKTVLIYSLIISVLHWIVDYSNCKIKKKFNKFKEWILFLIDQAIHIVIIFISWNFFEFNEHNYIGNLVSMLIKPKTIHVFNQITTNISSVYIENVIINKILIYGIVYVFFCIGGGYFISKILNDIGTEIEGQSLKNIGNEIQNSNAKKLENDTKLVNDDGLKKAGNLIGILERILIITLVINNSLTAIGFVITAKSIARYDKITTKKEFAEYFLIGTFLSTLIGMIGGYTLIGMISIFT